MVEYDQITTTTYALSDEASSIAKDGSHEFRVWNALPEGGEAMSSADLQVSCVPSRVWGWFCAWPGVLWC